MTMFPEHLLAVRATVETDREEEFNRWYNQEHLADAVKMLRGCLGGARYRVLQGDGSHHYLAIYAFESESALRAAMSSDALRELIRRYDAAVGSFSTRSRTAYSRVFQLDRSDV